MSADSPMRCDGVLSSVPCVIVRVLVLAVLVLGAGMLAAGNCYDAII